MKKLIAAALFLGLATACATRVVAPVQRIPFPEAEYATLKMNGTAVIRGQAFLKTRGGDVKTAAGNEVLAGRQRIVYFFATDHR